MYETAYTGALVHICPTCKHVIVRDDFEKHHRTVCPNHSDRANVMTIMSMKRFHAEYNGETK